MFTYYDKKGSGLTNAEIDANFRTAEKTIARSENSFFNVKSFGAVSDATGTIDNTIAFRRTQQACEAAGGGVCFVPVGIFYCNTLNANGNVIEFAQQSRTEPMIAVHWLGETIPAGIPYDTIPQYRQASIVGSKARATSADCSIIHCGQPQGVYQNYVSLVTENIIFRTTDNPTMSCVNAYWAACFEGIRCVCDTGVNQFALAEPTNNTFGFMMPAIGNYGTASLLECWVGGYGRGVVFSEHFMSNNTRILRCKIALETPGSFHTAAGTFNIFHCPILLKANGRIPVDFHFDLERSDDGKWWDYRNQGGNEIVNPAGATGMIRYAFTKAFIGFDEAPITASGTNTKLWLMNLGNPFASFPAGTGGTGSTGGTGGTGGTTTPPSVSVTVEDDDAAIKYLSSTNGAQTILPNGSGKGNGKMRMIDGDSTAYLAWTGSFQADHITVGTIKFPDCWSSMDVLIDSKFVGAITNLIGERVDDYSVTFQFALGTYSQVRIQPSAGATAGGGGLGHFYFDYLKVYKQ
jgi:hypothetical protein